MVPKVSATYFGQVMTANDMYTIAGSKAGTSGHTGDGGAATSALLNGPETVTLDSTGNLYIADSSNNRVQMVPKVSATYFGQVMTARRYVHDCGKQDRGDGVYSGWWPRDLRSV